MPEKDGDEGKSTKSVVNKKQKQMMGEEGYDIARDMGKVRPSKDKKDATTMPVSDEVKKTQKVVKGPSAFERVKAKYGKSVMNVGKKKVKEELDLTKVAEAFGGYIVESTKDEEQEKKERQTQREKIQKRFSDQAKSDASRRRTQGAGDRKDLGTGKGSERVTSSREPKKISGIDTKGTGRETVDKSQIKGIETETDREQTITRPKADRSDKARKDYNKFARDVAIGKREDRYKEKLKDPKFRASETLRKAKQTPIKGGPSVKRGDPVPQEVEPVKKKPVPEIGGFQFNTFKDSEMKKRKTFKQAFGQPTGADPVTGKPTYMRPGVLDKDGKPRPAQKRSKNLPDVDTVKTAIDMGVNPDEIDKNKFIDQKVRDARMKRLGTPDPFDPDYDKKVKKSVDKRTKIGKKIDKVFNAPKFQTAQRPLEVDRQTEVDAEKIGSQLKKTKKKFKDFDTRLRDTKVDADIERTIAGSGGGGRRTKTGTGTASDPEIVKNGRADGAINVTNVKLPSRFSQAKDKVIDFTKKNPVAALATYDVGKGILGKIMKAKGAIPGVVGGTVGRRSARGGGGL